MFNWLFKKGAPADQEPLSEGLSRWCAARSFPYLPDRPALAGQREADVWVPQRLPFASVQAQPNGAVDMHVFEDDGSDFILGNEMALRFCVCQVECPGRGPVGLYVARNWMRIPDLTLVSIPGGARGAQNALPPGSKLARSYVLQGDPAVVTRALESALSRRTWNVLVSGDWVTIHANAPLTVGGLDGFIMEASHVVKALPQR